MQALSFDNPIFVTYAIASGVMVLKAVAIPWVTVARMMYFRAGFRTPEDLKRTLLNPHPDPSQLLPKASVVAIPRQDTVRGHFAIFSDRI